MMVHSFYIYAVEFLNTANTLETQILQHLRQIFGTCSTVPHKLSLKQLL